MQERKKRRGKTESDTLYYTHMIYIYVMLAGFTSIILKSCQYLGMNNAESANFPSFINDMSLSASKELRVLQDI